MKNPVSTRDDDVEDESVRNDHIVPLTRDASGYAVSRFRLKGSGFEEILICRVTSPSVRIAAVPSTQALPEIFG
jgi:hypothetical protein